jgi:hypothetical protein
MSITTEVDDIVWWMIMSSETIGDGKVLSLRLRAVDGLKTRTFVVYSECKYVVGDKVTLDMLRNHTTKMNDAQKAISVLGTD